MITQQYIKELFHYNEHTGDFTRLIKRGSSHVGDIAGSITWNGYTSIYIDGKNYRAHQLAWLYVHGVWPDTDIDHINRNKSDNRIVNLRLASRSQNNINSGLHSHNTSGFRGVYASRNKWAAQIKLNGKKIYLGRFNTAEEAHQCYLAAARELYGEFVQQNPHRRAGGGDMEFTDYLIAKALILIALVAVYGFWRGFTGQPLQPGQHATNQGQRDSEAD